MPSYFQSTHSISIQAPPEKVYEALTDWSVRAQWRQGIEMEWEGAAKAFLDQKVTFRVTGLFPYSFSFRVAGLEPPRRFYMEYLGKNLRGRGAVEIAREENGSRVDFHWMKVEPEGLPAKIYFKLGWGMGTHRRQTLKTLRMLKQFLESNPSPAPRRQDAK